jgi:hypothetical protein
MVSFDVVARAADEHGMHAGYLIAMPANEKELNRRARAGDRATC